MRSGYTRTSSPRMCSLTMHAAMKLVVAGRRSEPDFGRKGDKKIVVEFFTTEETVKGHTNSIFHNVASTFGPFRTDRGESRNRRVGSIILSSGRFKAEPPDWDSAQTEANTMHGELDRQKDAMMRIPRRPAVHLCQSSAPFSPCGPLPNPRRALGYDVAAFSLVVAIRLERAAG
jgi:hypothetical protein